MPFSEKISIDNYKMPPLTAEAMDDRGAERLCAAIIGVACNDYVKEIRSIIHSHEVMRKPAYSAYLEGWFRSEDFKLYAGTTIDGEKLIEVLKYNTPEKYLNEHERKTHGLHLKELESEYFGKSWNGLKIKNLGSEIFMALCRDDYRPVRNGRFENPVLRRWYVINKDRRFVRSKDTVVKENRVYFEKYQLQTYRIVPIKAFSGDREKDNKKLLKILSKMEKEIGYAG